VPGRNARATSIDCQGIFVLSGCPSSDRNERPLWRALADRVKANGMLYITTDCVERKDGKYVFDNLRMQNFTVADLRERVEDLTSDGFTPMGVPDWRYHGPMVHDSYTFFRAGLLKLSRLE
jgi:hypothetical protein